MRRIIVMVNLAIICLQFSSADGQVAPSKDQLLEILSNKKYDIEKYAPEKLYLQFDKPYYAVGDTIWFKVYLLNNYLSASNESGIMYIDIANDSDKVIKQYKLPVAGGLSWGNIGLDEKDFTGGTYTIRAYTNWMRNFGSDYFFYKTLCVSSTTENNLLVNTRFSMSMVNDANVVFAKVLFSDVNKVPFAVEPMQLSIMSGSKRLYKQKLLTGVDGALDVNFNLPEKSAGLVLVAESELKHKKAVIPIDLNRAENADVQFLPEGGSLVAGLPAHIGFKAIGGDGKGIDISGIITDSNQQQVSEFKSLHKGVGSFELFVQPGQTYTAKVTLPGGLVKTYPLPPVKSSGMVLNIKNMSESDSLTVSVFASDDIARAGNSYFLIGEARGVVCYAAVISFNKVNFIKSKTAKSLFPTGIAHFTILTTNNQPLNERLVYIDHHDDLNIKLTADKPGYSTRDSIALNIKATDSVGKPVSGQFSLAVTDDRQVKPDSANSENLLTRMLLTADLKGYVEEPGYYFNSTTHEAWQALDNLLLTQGWIGYDEEQAARPQDFTYQPENDFVVKGAVHNAFNKPVAATHVLLFSKKPAILMDTVTDETGQFVFDRLPRVDTPVLVLKALNKNGKSFNVQVNVNEVKPPDFAKPLRPLWMPWYVNSDTTLLNYAKNDALKQQAESFTMGGHVLKQVTITAKKIVKGSQNLNGPGNADLVLDEKDMEAAGKKTWLQLLQENVKGFAEGTFFLRGISWTANLDRFLAKYVTDANPSLQWYFINRKPIKLIVDGTSVTQVFTSSPQENSSAFYFMRDYLNGHSAEDLKGIEVIYTSKNAAAYLTRYDPGDLLVAALSNNPPVNISPSDIAFVEITTRSGNGPVVDNTPGMYLYKPLPTSWPKQFYKPRYSVRDTSNHPVDYRSTIDWEPNIVTDANGEAKVWFYASDKPSTYTVTIEGTDMNGHLGYKTGKIVVKEIENQSK